MSVRHINPLSCRRKLVGFDRALILVRLLPFLVSVLRFSSAQYLGRVLLLKAGFTSKFPYFVQWAEMVQSEWLDLCVLTLAIRIEPLRSIVCQRRVIEP